MFVRRQLLRRGTVSEFDEPRGLGTVTDEQGVVYAFHCASIADGTRRVDVETPVLFVVAPGHLGCYEAREIQKVRPGASIS